MYQKIAATTPSLLLPCWEWPQLEPEAGTVARLLPVGLLLPVSPAVSKLKSVCRCFPSVLRACGSLEATCDSAGFLTSWEVHGKKETESKGTSSQYS